MQALLSTLLFRAATAGKAGKVWSLSRFWVSIRSYKKQPNKKFWGRILDLAWLKIAALLLLHSLTNWRLETSTRVMALADFTSAVFTHVNFQKLKNSRNKCTLK